MPKLAVSLTTVVVARDECPSLETLQEISAVLCGCVEEFDFAIVANASDNATAIGLKSLAEVFPDLTIVFLSARVHDEVARLIGIDIAIGDFILYPSLGSEEIKQIPRVLDAVPEGYDLILGIEAGRLPVKRSIAAKICYAAFRIVFRSLTGIEFEPDPATLRLLSRATALLVSTRSDGEVLIRARTIGPGFPSKIVDLPPTGAAKSASGTIWEGFARSFRLILTANASPLRASSCVALLGSVLSVVYSGYVVLVYFFKPEVAAGWTTLSLQISGMMFIFSILFVFFAEYLIQLTSANPTRSRRHLVFREIRSRLSRRRRRLNVASRQLQARCSRPHFRGAGGSAMMGGTPTIGLIGHTGYVGGTLLKHASFNHLYNSSNIDDIAGREFELVVCAGVSAAKWLANKEPDTDRAGIARLTDALRTVKAQEFILNSTIDVYPDPSIAADEGSAIEPSRNHPYGRHRYELEAWVVEHFPLVRIIRLPALFGQGLRKNVLFDLLNDNAVRNINPAGIYQWYPMRRLWADVVTIRRANLALANLFTAPLPMADIIDAFFADVAVGEQKCPAPRYDLRTKHAPVFGGGGGYALDAEVMLGEMARFVIEERRRARVPGPGSSR
jgi:hypothetical protein